MTKYLLLLSLLVTPLFGKPLVFQPEWHWADGTTTHQGTASFLKAPDGSVVALTSAHFLNFSGIPLRAVTFLDPSTRQPAATSTKSWGEPGREGSYDPLDLRTDYFLLKIDPPSEESYLLELDERELPEVGESVWFPNKTATGFECVGGKVLEATPEYITVELAQPISLDSRSGTPVLSQTTRHVIGILTGGSEANDHTRLYLAPATPIRHALRSATHFPCLHQCFEEWCDGDGTRYTLTSANHRADLNWLFFPGGPGASSSYLVPLIEALDLPGRAWRVDLPGNGEETGDCTFDRWLDLYPKACQQFHNTIVVGHSFGGILAFQSRELEEKIHGLVCLNSSPYPPRQEEVEKYVPPSLLVDRSELVALFRENPCRETLHRLLLAAAPRHFPPATLEEGSKLLVSIPFNWRGLFWFEKWGDQHPSAPKWIPAEVPTLIIGGACDYISPFALFEQNEQFERPNIDLCSLENSGHWCWIDRPEKVKELFHQFTLRIGHATEE